MKRNKTLKSLEQLEAIYALFDEQVQLYYKEHDHEQKMVCKKGCAQCCTCNVTLTRLESLFMIQLLSDTQKQAMLRKIEIGFSKKRYIPKMTFNQFARLCMEGKTIPDEVNDPSWGQCSLLDAQVCSCYEQRPFGCRALLSSADCKTQGYADLPPYLLTLNNLFLQYIEHLDQDGFSGNLSDMLTLFLTGRDQEEDVEQICSPMQSTDSRFIRNETVKVLMVPPEHQQKIRPIIERLNTILQGLK